MKALWLHFVLLVLLTISIAAQSVPVPSAPPDETVLKIQTQEVMLPVTVRDRAGQLVTNLTARDFKVYEDNSPQSITSFALRKLPVNVILLIDTSSSVTREIEDFKQAALNFAAQLEPDDKISLLKFDDKVELVLDWTTNRAALRRALNRLTTGTFTNFHDALWLAANEQFKQINGRKAIIVLTDGIDSGRGRKTQAQALRALLEAEAPVYAISKTEIQRTKDLRDLTFYQQNYSEQAAKIRIDGIKLSIAALNQSEVWLQQLATETGGRIFLPHSFQELDQVYQQVADELRAQYVLFYHPQNPDPSPRYRTIRVKVTPPELHATTRLGYYSK